MEFAKKMRQSQRERKPGRSAVILSLSLSLSVCVCVLRSGVADVNCTLLNIVVHISCSSWQTAADTDTSTRVIGNYP